MSLKVSGGSMCVSSFITSWAVGYFPVSFLVFSLFRIKSAREKKNTGMVHHKQKSKRKGEITRGHKISKHFPFFVCYFRIVHTISYILEIINNYKYKCSPFHRTNLVWHIIMLDVIDLGNIFLPYLYLLKINIFNKLLTTSAFIDLWYWKQKHGMNIIALHLLQILIDKNEVV